jgi:hexokinase
MNESRSKAERFLARVGLNAASVDVNRMLEDFRNEMEAGLAGKPSSLAMIPTYLTADVEVPPDTPVIALDAGGTNLRIALVTFDAAGCPHIEDFSRHPMPGAEGPVTKDEFYDRFVHHIRPFAPQAERVGFCFSYPAEISPECDGRLLVWSKEIQAPEVVGEFIGANIFGRLKNLGYALKYTLLNDTVAALLAGRGSGRVHAADSYVGFILGTGTNTAYVEKNRDIIKQMSLDPEGSQAINVESGNFDKAPRTVIDERLDITTNNPGAYSFEKMISGAYLGPLGREVLVTAAEQGLFSQEGSAWIRSLKGLTTADMGRFLDTPYVGGALDGNTMNEADREIAGHLIRAVIARAALFAAVNIGAAALKSGTSSSGEISVCVNIDGSTFYKTPGLHSQTQGYLREILSSRGVSAELVRIKDSPLIGAAVAGLTRA